MSYHIIVSAQQLRVIKAALEVCPTLDDKDEYGDNVQEVLTAMVEETLKHPEDDTVHGWVV